MRRLRLGGAKPNPNPNPNPNQNPNPNPNPNPNQVAWLRAYLPPKPQGRKGKGQAEGESLLAYKIELHWPLDERWYRATIIKCVPRTGKHLLVYEEDGVQEWR